MGLPGFDINNDGKVDLAEEYLSYRAHIDSTDSTSTQNIDARQNQQSGAGCLTTTIMILIVVALIITALM